MTTSPLSGESFEDMRARIAEDAAAARARHHAIRNLAAQVDAATGQARSQDGDITVTCASSGAIARIDIADRAMDLTGAALAAQLTQVIAKAQRAAVAEAARIASAELGDDHPLVTELAQSGERFGRGQRGAGR